MQSSLLVNVILLLVIFFMPLQADYMDINSTAPELNFQYMLMGNLVGFATTFLLLFIVILVGRK